MGALADTSRVDQVLVYPGGATVERVVAVKAGQKELRLHCLSSRFDAESLQIQASPGVTLGAISVRTIDRASVPECANTLLDQRIAALAGQLETVGAEIAARELGFEYLKAYRPNPAPAPATLAGTMEALRKSAIDQFPPYQALTRRQKELKAQLAPLEAERDKLHAAQPKLRILSVQMAATRNAEVRLSERTTRAGWVPVYRAYLDTVSGQLRLERHAQLSQASGEDWSDVKLRLLTTKPRDAIGMRSPDPWTLDLVRVSAADAPIALALSMPPPHAVLRAAPSHMDAMQTRGTQEESEEIVAPVQMIESEFAAEFDVPGRASVAADGQHIVLKLGEALLPSKVMARTQPAVEEQAYLVAESARPEGLWPVGQVQLFRDGTFVGQSDLRMADQPQLDLFFGIDELVRVRAEPEQRYAGATGLIGQRTETKISRVYRVENLHQRRFNVQVLEAAPVSRHDDIKVQRQLHPQPAQDNWRQQPGVLAWELVMEPRAVQRIGADYIVSYPKEAVISGLPDR